MMLRILISMVLIFAVVWYMLKDGNENNKVLKDQAEDIELARTAVQANENASATSAEESDSIRDAAMGATAPDSAPPDPANPEQ